MKVHKTKVRGVSLHIYKDAGQLMSLRGYYVYSFCEKDCILIFNKEEQIISIWVSKTAKQSLVIKELSYCYAALLKINEKKELSPQIVANCVGWAWKAWRVLDKKVSREWQIKNPPLNPLLNQAAFLAPFDLPAHEITVLGEKIKIYSSIRALFFKNLEFFEPENINHGYYGTVDKKSENIHLWVEKSLDVKLLMRLRTIIWLRRKLAVDFLVASQLAELESNLRCCEEWAVAAVKEIQKVLDKPIKKL